MSLASLFAVIGIVLTAWLVFAYIYEDWNYGRFVSDGAGVITERCYLGWSNATETMNPCLDCEESGTEIGWAWTKWKWVEK